MKLVVVGHKQTSTTADRTHERGLLKYCFDYFWLAASLDLGDPLQTLFSQSLPIMSFCRFRARPSASTEAMFWTGDEGRSRQHLLISEPASNVL